MLISTSTDFSEAMSLKMWRWCLQDGRPLLPTWMVSYRQQKIYKRNSSVKLLSLCILSLVCLFLHNAHPYHSPLWRIYSVLTFFLKSWQLCHQVVYEKPLLCLLEGCYMVILLMVWAGGAHKSSKQPVFALANTPSVRRSTINGSTQVDIWKAGQH